MTSTKVSLSLGKFSKRICFWSRFCSCFFWRQENCCSWRVVLNLNLYYFSMFDRPNHHKFLYKSLEDPTIIDLYLDWFLRDFVRKHKHICKPENIVLLPKSNTLPLNIENKLFWTSFLNQKKVQFINKNISIEIYIQFIHNSLLCTSFFVILILKMFPSDLLLNLPRL